MPPDNGPTSLGVTAVDLGEDLLVSGTVSLEQGAGQVTVPSDLMNQAKLCFQEGFWEDAKKHLRALLIQEPFHQPAKKLLETLLAQEWQRLYLNEEPSSHVTSVESPDQVLRTLEVDWKLRPFQTSPEAFFFHALNLNEHTLSTWIDLGISFLMAQYFSSAIVCFQKAIHKAPHFTTVLLLAWSYFWQAQEWQTIMVLEHFLKREHPPLRLEEEVEMHYLLGRAYEQVCDPDQAKLYFDKVMQAQPSYRDVPQRRAAL